MMSKTKDTVMIAMSGGVDSSVAAAVLKEQGYNVVGVTMLLWPEDVPGAEEGCCGSVHLADARAVCRELGIRHYTLDLQKEFMSDVVQPFVETYMQGRTPNPCILCNEHLKFRHLLGKARAVGADKLATGHYARVLGEGPFQLARGQDNTKDQTYFLFPVGQDVLSQLLLPLGDMTKRDVRKKAEELNLQVQAKPESQEICFVPPGGLRDFIRDKADGLPGPGEVIGTDGRKLGTHEGACFYTVGQRRGLGIASAEPMYVVRIDAETNTVLLGSREEAEFQGLEAENCIWIMGEAPEASFRAGIQIRHRHNPAPGTVTVSEKDKIQVDFDEPQHGVAPGQAVVVYDGDVVVGGGWIVSGMV